MSKITTVRERVNQLLQDARRLSIVNQHGQVISAQQRFECAAWLTAAQNAVHLICDSDLNPYQQKADRLASADHGFGVGLAVGELAAMLKALVTDADAGLLSSIADQTRAETFDDFLDHAQSYADDRRKEQSGAIAGVVFEDSMRRICARRNIDQKDRKLDDLISDLVKAQALSPVQAKRARAAADVRTKATHAQWDEFSLHDVQAAITFTRELIASQLT